MKRWDDLQEECSGVKGVAFTLSGEEPVLGTWTIYVITDDGRVFNTTFYVTRQRKPNFSNCVKNVLE